MPVHVTLKVMPLMVNRLKASFPENGHLCECDTIADAVRIYQAHLNANLHLNPEGKCYKLSSESADLQPVSVDIHVVRNGKDICTDRNLQFPLLNGDVVALGVKIC
jgi:hypothetical protein